MIVRGLLRSSRHLPSPSSLNIYSRRCLTDLDLSSNPLIGDRGGRAVSSVLQTAFCPLRRLNLRHCGLTHHIINEIFISLRHNSRLVVLDLGENEIVDTEDATTGLDQLTRSLLVNRTLQELRLDGVECGLRAQPDCRQIARILSTNTCLCRLVLSNNSAVGDEGVERLAEGLKFNRGRLRELRLVNCRVGDEGLRALVDSTTIHGVSMNLTIDVHDTTSSRVSFNDCELLQRVDTLTQPRVIVR